jgi:hypothetical protein
MAKKSPVAKATEAPSYRGHPLTGLKAPKGVSYSQLTSFEECGALHDLVRNQKLVEGFTGSVFTEIGSACHDPLEIWLNQFLGDALPVYATVYDVMVAEGGYWDTKLAELGLEALKPQLQRYAHYLTNLYYRAHPSYTGKDAIRNKDGAVSKAPYMTGVWKDYMREHKLLQLEQEINTTAARACPAYVDIPFAQVYTESIGIMYPYKHPAAIASVVGVELPISEVMYQAQQPVLVEAVVGQDAATGADVLNWVQAVDAAGKPLWEPMVDAHGAPVPSSVRRGPYPVWVDDTGRPLNFLEVVNPFYLPVLEDGKLVPDPDKPGDYLRRDDVVFTCFIDLLARDADDQLLVLDHKTNGGEPPSPFKVSNHEQLNLYAFVIELIYGERAKKLGINHLRSNRLVLADYDPATGKAALERLLSLVREIDLKVYTKRDPFAYSNPCIKADNRDKNKQVFCPGLKHCHPGVYNGYKKLGAVA